MTPIPTELREMMEHIVSIGPTDYETMYRAKAQLKYLLATPPADAADMGGQAGEEVVAWCTPERDRVITEITKAGARADGGAMLSSVQPYSEPLMTVSQHLRILAQHRQQAGKLVEALSACRSELHAMITAHNVQSEHDGSWLYDYQTVSEADEAIADWEKTQ